MVAYELLLLRDLCKMFPPPTNLVSPHTILEIKKPAGIPEQNITPF